MNNKKVHIINNNNVTNYLHSKDVELHFHLGLPSDKPQYQPPTLSSIGLLSWDPIFTKLGFFFSALAAVVDQVNSEQCIRAVFMGPTNFTFQQFFIKNRSHSTFHTFKNYFVIVFSVLNCHRTHF